MKQAKGQGMVEFALVIPVFLALVVGLLDGCRLLFTYNELQEAARVGARWGAVEVNRSPWATFSTGSLVAVPGNAQSCTSSGCTAVDVPLSSMPFTVTGTLTPTIAGEVARKLIAVNRANVRLSITTPITGGYTEFGRDNILAGNPVTVTVAYTFSPVLSLGHMNIKLVGRSAQQHE
jgi:Flp pilus assembly protein TadG